MQNTNVTRFTDLSLPESLKASIAQMGFTEPTPIQAKAIPIAMDNRDIVASAQTGTGKTAAFCIPMITKLLRYPHMRALILAPTRELSIQIGGVLREILQSIPQITSASLVGGLPMGPQIGLLRRKPRIIVATPGRLVDHLKRQTLTLNTFQVFVLDEADRMLDMGFADQLNFIVSALPQKRQTLLFSATFSPAIEKLAGKYLTDPIRISVGPVSKPIEEIKQAVIQTTNGQKNSVLFSELKAREGSVLIFARTKSRTDRLARQLTEAGHNVSRIHGGRTQGQRNSAIENFRSGRVRIMVATDIAARGIDIPHIAHVINYDLPDCSEDYVHRIGRTARAGAEGCALNLVVPEQKEQWHDISRKFLNGDKKEFQKENRSNGPSKPGYTGRFRKRRRRSN